MQSFTTQSHQRNYQGNVVLEPNQYTAAAKPQGHKPGKIRGIITTSVLALAVAVSGSWLGATTVHNLKNHAAQAEESQDFIAVEPNIAMETQAVQVAEEYTVREMEDGHCVPTTLELRHDQWENPVMTLEARPEDNATDTTTKPATNDERPQHRHEGRPPRHHGKRMQRVPVADEEHAVEQMPRVDRHGHRANDNN